MEKQLTIDEELKTLFSEAETLKLIILKASSKNLNTIENKEEREKIAKYQNLFVKHLLEFAGKYKITNNDVAKMLSSQVGGEWQIKCDYSYGKNVKLFATFSKLGVAARVIDEKGRKEGEISLCEFWSVTNFNNHAKQQELTNLNWIIPYFLRLATIKGVRANALDPISDSVRQNNLYLTIFNLLDTKLKAMANPPASAAVGKK